MLIFRYQDAAIEVPYSAIKSSMSNWRKAICPANPKSLTEFVIKLNTAGNEHLTAYNDAAMTVDSVIDRDQHEHVVFYDQNFVLQIIPGVSKVFIDATFQTTPTMVGVAQLLTVMVVAYGHVSSIHFNSNLKVQ